MPELSLSAGLLPAALLGIGLAASSGLRTFLPLLLLALAARFNPFGSGLELGESFGWLLSNTALSALAIATVVEVLGDKVPAVDHLLDAVGTVARPVAGGLATTAVVGSNDPALGAILGIVVGAPLALGVHTAKAGSRGVSTASTMGVANPILSLLEDFASLFVALLALVAPLLVPILLAVAGVLLWKIYRLAQRLRRFGRKETPGEKPTVETAG